MKFLAFITVILAGILLFWKINTYPITPAIYEGLCGLSVLKVIDGDKDQIGKIWHKPIRTQPGGGSGVGSGESDPFLIYPTAWIVKLLGTDDNYFSLRLVSIFYGILGVGLLYLLAARLFNPGIGLISAFILATSSWALTYSRVCLDLSATVFFVLLCFYFFAVIDRPDNPLGYIILGGLISLATYFYLPARIVAPVVVVAMLLRMLGEKGYFKTHYQYFVLLLIFFLVGLHLQKGNFKTYFQQNIPRSFYAWKMKPEAQLNTLLMSNIALYRDHATKWGWRQGEVYERDAAFDPVTRYCFLIGMIWLLAKIKKHRYRFLLLWTLAALLPMLLTYAHFRRAILFAPAMYTVAGVGIYNTVYYMTIWMGRARGHIKTFIILAILLPIAYLNITHYFGLYAATIKNPQNTYVRRRDQRKKLLELMKKNIVYTNLYRSELGWIQSIEYEEKRLGLKSRCVRLPQDKARQAFEKDKGHCALYLNTGELKTK